MSRHVFVVDGNSIAHANHNANVLTVGDMQVQAIFGTLKSLNAICQSNSGDFSLLILWDGKAQWRLDLYPDYKGNRKALNPVEQAAKEAFKRQTPYLEKMLEFLGVPQLRSPLAEADDLAGMLVPMFAANGTKVTMVSGDRDWLQLIGPGVSWHDPVRDRRVDETNFFTFTGYHTTTAFVEGKALQGDTSDNILGIEKLGEKTAQLFLAKWGSVSKFFEAVDAGDYTPATRKSKNAASKHPEELLASPEGRAVFERNLRLMDLQRARKPAPGELIRIQKEPDLDKFQLLCEKLAFASILRELRLNRGYLQAKFPLITA